MLLLYTILIEKSINIRKIILNEIHDCAKKKIRSAYFPSLITSLCLRAHVQTQANLKGRYVQECISNHDLERLVEKVHELNQGEQEDPTEPDIEESTNEIETEANSVTDIEEEESNKELNNLEPVEGSVTPEPRFEPQEEPVKLSVEPKSTTPIPTSTSLIALLDYKKSKLKTKSTQIRLHMAVHLNHFLV
ncbi:hypothetical protein PVK06_026790 [Gossypium arboreum]|uniref:Uncharacterized protein n=1 Tax=Gossypium arboreum TaxID=29729 RepID=A0ABR0NYM1_GOSAR|nr:hypothetical protein PVK06_026790 [Gossypium arboreum]